MLHRRVRPTRRGRRFSAPAAGRHRVANIHRRRTACSTVNDGHVAGARSAARACARSIRRRQRPNRRKYHPGRRWKRRRGGFWPDTISSDITGPGRTFRVFRSADRRAEVPDARLAPGDRAVACVTSQARAQHRRVQAPGDAAPAAPPDRGDSRTAGRRLRVLWTIWTPGGPATRNW